MANVTVNGNNYTGVTEVLLPITNGGGSEQSFIIPSGSKNITANGNGIDVAAYESVNVNVSGDTPSMQQKSVTAPASGTTAVTPDSGYDGLSRVTVSPTPTETKNIIANGTYTPTSGKHFSQVTVNVPGDTPQTQEKTVSPSTSQQIVTPDSGKLLSKVTVNAIPEGTAGTPTATKGAVSNHSVTVTPSVTNTTGYIDGGTKTGTPVTVSASELTSGSETKQQNGTYDVTNLRQIVVNVSGGSSYSYAVSYEDVTDRYGLFTMRTLAKPEHVEMTLSTNDPVASDDWHLDFTIDFGTSDFIESTMIDEDGTVYTVLSSRSSYGYAADILYTPVGGSIQYWTSSNPAQRAKLSVTVYSNQPVYEGFTPGVGFWKTDGKRIIDEDGNPVLLNGVGMFANSFTESIVSKRGDPSTWEVSEAAIAEIASLGFNCVRLVFGYQLLEDDENPGVYKSSGWTWLETISGWASTHGVKIVLNLHCPVPAVQYSPSVESYNFWLESQYGYQQRTINMWAAIANHFKNNTTFIGWGLINELHLKLYDYSLASTHRAESDLFQRIINAIRTVDKNHMIFVERGLWFYDDEDYQHVFGSNPTYLNISQCNVYYPTLADSNMLCEWHNYGGIPTRSSTTGAVTPGENRAWMEANLDTVNTMFYRLYGNDAPIYIGEYGCNWAYDGVDGTDEDFIRWTKDSHEMYTDRGIAHSLHTFYGWHKGAGTYNSMGLRYVTAYHNDAMTQGTLYQPLADIYIPQEIRLQSKTVSPSTSQQTVSPDSGYDGLSSVTVNAMSEGTAGTPSASKGAVSNHSVAVTPSVTNVTGYITGGTKTGTPVTVSASELVSGSETKTQNGTYDVTNLAQLIVNVSGGSTVQTHSGTGTTNSSGIAVINDCGFRPDIVLLEIGTYTTDGNTYYSSMTFPLFADRVNRVESVAWSDSAGVNFIQFYGVAYDQTQNGVTIKLDSVRNNWQISPLASIPVPYTAYKFL